MGWAHLEREGEGEIVVLTKLIYGIGGSGFEGKQGLAAQMDRSIEMRRLEIEKLLMEKREWECSVQRMRKSVEKRHLVSRTDINLKSEKKNETYTSQSPGFLLQSLPLSSWSTPWPHHCWSDELLSFSIAVYLYS